MLSGGRGEIRPSKPITILREQGQLVLELCHFTEDLNAHWPTGNILSHLQTLSRTITDELKTVSCQKKQFRKINQYFFEDLGFQCNDDNKSLQASFIPQVLSSREGPTPLLMLLYCSLCEEVGIRVQVTSCRLKYLLKIQINSKTQVFDFRKKCRSLKPHELVDLINRGFDFSGGSLNTNILVVEYLHQVCKKARKENELEILSLVHSYLMKYQPFNLKHLSERAAVAYETGDYKTAIEDIRSYFLYKQPELNNMGLKKIYKKALKAMRKLESQTSNTLRDSIKSL